MVEAHVPCCRRSALDRVGWCLPSLVEIGPDLPELGPDPGPRPTHVWSNSAQQVAGSGSNFWPKSARCWPTPARIEPESEELRHQLLKPSPAEAGAQIRPELRRARTGSTGNPLWQEPRIRSGEDCLEDWKRCRREPHESDPVPIRGGCRADPEPIRTLGSTHARPRCVRARHPRAYARERPPPSEASMLTPPPWQSPSPAAPPPQPRPEQPAPQMAVPLERPARRVPPAVSLRPHGYP